MRSGTVTRRSPLPDEQRDRSAARRCVSETLVESPASAVPLTDVVRFTRWSGRSGAVPRLPASCPEHYRGT
ncbi:hypothetical protein CDG81_14060 [Actinopolyspora erythraea]|uniref:Uncharacterized protein n=1 Tax=Actinopolyspora erythraea TaxID=414996 RepID=A0A099D403_9ACTN|nr:hypothetical protein CDG81_14060 [Actinopolyspora erythraea]KGI80799.1 hypothetical protein IL38_15725 [Actinopolyspora erythraea]